jgi:hypothetical protein|tara:strand:+ start:1665 stop:1997 length:333 start_codon:yes stop_codon:yes gene_type:complete
MNASIKRMKGHWSGYANEKRRWTERIWAEAKAQKIEPMATPIRVVFNWRMPNMRRDPDGLRGFMVKYILDGLVKAKIIPDDNAKFIVGFEDNFILDRDNPGVDVTLITCE